MPAVVFTQHDGAARSVQVDDGTTLMRAAVANGIEGIVGECGGQAMCATCHVYVRPEYQAMLPALSEEEDEMLECTLAERTERSRLGCQIAVDGQLSGIVVDVPAEQV